MVKALTMESRRRLMLAYKSELDNTNLAASLANIAIRIPSRNRIAPVPESPHPGRVEEIPEVLARKVIKTTTYEEAIEYPVRKNPVLKKSKSSAPTNP